MSRSLLNKTSRVGAERPVAGSAVDASSYIDTESLQVSGAGAQTQRMTVTGGSAKTYAWKMGEDSGSLLDLTYVSSGTNTTTIAAGIADAINAKVGVSQLCFAENVGAEVDVTGRQKGASATFAFEESDADLEVDAAVSPTDATAISFGTMVEKSTRTSPAGTTGAAAAVGTGTYTAQVTTITLTGTTQDETITCTVRADLDGNGKKEHTVSIVTTNDLTHNALGLEKALASVLDSTLIGTGASVGVVTLTALVAGLEFEVVECVAISSASGTPTNTATVANSTPNAIPFGGGVATQSNAISQDENGDTKYTSGTTLSAMCAGKIHVLLDAGITVAIGDPCFVRVAISGTEVRGAFRNSKDSTDCLPLSSFGFKGAWLGSNFTDMDGNNVAALNISRN